MAAAEEEFAKLKETVELVCDIQIRKPPVRQMRIPDKWERQRQNENYKPLYCFAISHSPLSPEAEDLSSESSLIKIFILIPENCSLYHFANFIAFCDRNHRIACVGANSKIYVFGGGCGTRVWYMDVVRSSNKQGKEWKQAKACFNREKCRPLSFSLGNKIYALETRYSPTPFEQDSDSEVYDDDCRFEVLDTSTDCSCWLPLCSPPYPFGEGSVGGSWSTDSSGDQGDGYRIFIEEGNYLFVYDVDTNTWDKFKRQYNPMLKRDCSRPSHPDYGPPDYKWALDSVGNDFAPFPPQVQYTSDLRVLTGLKRSTPELHQLACEHQDGLPLPCPVNVETDRMVKLSVLCKNSSRSLTGWDLESLWSLHCLQIERMLFWQAIHLGGSRFCTLAYYIQSYCCCKHPYLYARVANFDITDAAAGGASDEPVFSAEYSLNKVYLVSKDSGVDPLPKA